MRVAFADIGGIRTRYLHEGSGSVVVLLHGFGFAGDSWLRNIDVLGQPFSVIAPDTLGHGYTDAAALNGDQPQGPMVQHLGRLMDHLGAERYSVVGSSYGGLLAALMYFERPERVDKLILVGTGTVFHPQEQLTKALSAALENVSAAMGDPTLESCRTRIAAICHDPASVPENLLLSQLTSFALPDRFDFYQAAIGGLVAAGDAQEHRAYHRLEEIGVPTLVITGRNDIRTSWELVQQGCERIPGAELVIFDGCGHLPMIEHAERFNQLVVAFLSH